VLVLGVNFALAAPTVLLESTTATWYPGTRSRMFQEGFEPVLDLSILYLVTEFLFKQKADYEVISCGSSGVQVTAVEIDGQD
jgi:hypothetical protein